MISVNERAATIVQEMISEQEALGFRATKLKNGATVLDAGIHVTGSFEGGRLFACACLGGLGQVGFTLRDFRGPESNSESDLWFPAVEVSVESPHIACMASQYAGWAVQLDRYFAIGSGPARALWAGEEIFAKLDYKDQADTAVLMLEGRTLPDEEVADFVAQMCGVNPERLFLVIAPTASVVGSIQVAARSAETGMHKLAELGFDVRCIQSASGICPLAPVAADDLRAIGRTNDAILYGAQVSFAVRAEDRVLSELIDRVPSESSRDYGTPFYELFQRYNGDFYKIDRMLFSPARIEINNLDSGHTFRAGRLNPSLLRSSLMES
ncbi:MAG TPA: methenyltetrahydromethanopterin cyclohydrolase [Acidobacteriota bacterium]|nr:methenyltetrahydromethanopterin cyclohydrolase [Acidobacteriota bacterium]